MDKIEVRDMRNGNWLWIHKFIVDSRVLSVYHKQVYQALCYFSNNENQDCFPSHQTLAGIANVSEPTIRKYLNEIEEFGLIKIVRGGKGAKDTNHYLLKRISEEGMAALEGRWRIAKARKTLNKG